MKSHSTSQERGFTLIEMVVVCSLILILLSISLPLYNHAIIRSKEAKLHNNVAVLNELIDRYSLDKGQAPQSLDDLVNSGYIKAIPEDITSATNTWETVAEDPQNCWDPNQCGIGSVHSGSKDTASDGTPYSSWTH
jgi:general secretion pathway protein G